MANKYKFMFLLEMRAGQDLREVEADSFEEKGEWLIFKRYAPTGGPWPEYWRVRLCDVISMETKR